MKPLLTYFTLFILIILSNNSLSAQDDISAIMDDSFRIQSGFELNGSVRDNDRFTDADLAVNWGGYKVVEQPKNNSLFSFDEQSGEFTYVSKPNYVGKDVFTYMFYNTLGYKDTAKVVIQVFANIPPSVNNDYESMDLGDGYELQIMPLVNDKDPDGDLSNSTLSIYKQPIHGTVNESLFGFDILEYVADKDFIGVDSFRYKLCDAGGSCGLAWVYINITDKNRNYPPEAENDFYECNFKGIEADASLNDTDLNGNDFLNYELLSKSNPLSTFEMGYNGGWFNYLPAPRFSGKDTVYYRVCDAGSPSLCDTAMIVFDVAPHKAPVVKSFNINITFNLSEEFFMNDVVESGLDITYSIKQQPKNGILEILDEAGHWRYTGKKAMALDTIAYEVCDEIQECTMGYIYIRITENYAPHSSDLSFEDIKNTPFSGALEIYDNELNILQNSISVIKQPLHGTFSLKEYQDFESGYYKQNFTFIPQKDFVGQDSVNVSICDTEGACDTVTIHFNYLDTYAPIAFDDIYTVFRNETVEGSVSKNDIDIDNNIDYSSFKVIKNAQLGTLEMQNDGNFSYKAKTSVGTDTIAYTVCDFDVQCDTGLLIIKIEKGDANPRANDDIFTVSMDTEFQGSLTTNDSLYKVAVFEYKVIKNTQYGLLTLDKNGTFKYLPKSAYTGSDNAQYVVCDLNSGLCDTAMVTFNIIKVNRKPTLGNDEFKTTFNTLVRGSVAQNDSDSDNDLNKNSYTIVQNPKNGSVKIWNDGRIAYLPKHNFAGKDTFYYQACDQTQLCEKAQCVVTVQAGVVTGKIYYDTNANGFFDATEKGLPNALIRINDNIEIVTNADGDYYLPVDTSKVYYIAPVINNTAYIFTPAMKALNTSNDFNQVISNQNFALQAPRNINDLAISLEQGNARPGYTSSSILTYKNLGNTTIDATVKLTLDNNLAFESADIAPTTIEGNILTWNIKSLKPTERKNINLMLKTAVKTPLNSAVTLNGEGIITGTVDNDTSNNKAVVNVIARGSYDPNDISVDIKEVKQIGTIKESDVALTYTIRFQNTGNAEAYRVEVIDTLSEKLDISTLEIMAASHPFEAKIVSDNSSSNTIVKFLFDNINLLDSTSKEACSHGFVKFRINNVKSKTNYSSDKIQNKAAIYFDFNEPVITNTASTIFTLSSPTKDVNNVKFSVYPNPAHDIINIALEKDETANIQIINAVGQIVKSQNVSQNFSEIDVNNLQNGFYFIQVTTAKGKGIVKFVKE